MRGWSSSASMSGPPFGPKRRSSSPESEMSEDSSHVSCTNEVIVEPKWNEAAITYYGMADLTDGSDPQRGYFHNVRADGDQDWGSFEGKITTSGEQVTLEGAWRFNRRYGQVPWHLGEWNL